MNFWGIVESSTPRPFSVEGATKRLVSVLTTMGEVEVLEFCREFDRRMDEAYTWELWGVAYLIHGGCGDDSFLDFRSSLIAQGREIYEKAIEDAESLISIDRSELEEMFEEGYSYAPTRAYEQMTGSAPDTGVSRKPEPTGTRWDETRESLQDAFPRAWDVYGWEDEDSSPPAPRRPWWKLW